MRDCKISRFIALLNHRTKIFSHKLLENRICRKIYENFDVINFHRNSLFISKTETLGAFIKKIKKDIRKKLNFLLIILSWSTYTRFHHFLLFHFKENLEKNWIKEKEIGFSNKNLFYFSFSVSLGRKFLKVSQQVVDSLFLFTRCLFLGFMSLI